MTDFMTKELDELLGVQRRKKKKEVHETGRISAIQMSDEIALYSGIPKKIVKAVIRVFLKVLRRHLIEHKRITLTGIGTFYFQKAAPRKVCSNYRGKQERYEVPAKCRLKFTTNNQFASIAGWYPSEEIQEEREKEAYRRAKLAEELHALRRAKDEARAKGEVSGTDES